MRKDKKILKIRTSPMSTEPYHPTMILLSIHPTHMLRTSNKFYFPTLKYVQTSRTIKYSGEINRKKQHGGNRDYAKRGKSQKVILNILSVIGEDNATLKQEQGIQYRSVAKRIPKMVANGNLKVTAVHQVWRQPVQTKSRSECSERDHCRR